MEFTILLITIIFVSLFQIAIPFYVKRTVVFGVTIPYEEARGPKVMYYKKLYAVITAIASIIAITGFLIWNQATTLNETKLVLIGSLIPFVILIIGLTLYFYFHYKITKLKNDQKWFEEINQVRIADLEARSKDEMLSSSFHLIPAVISITLIILSIPLFDQIPNQIPTHWGPDGTPDVFTAKSWLSVSSLPIISLVFQLMCFGTNLSTKRSGIKINAGNVKSSKLRQLRLRKYSSWFLFLTNILITLLFAILHLNLLYEDLFSGSLLLFVPFGFIAIILVGVLILAIKVGSVDSDFEGKMVDDQSTNSKTESVDEDKYWKGGLIYFNQNDPSIFVEKRFGIGWTLNCANPIGYFVVLVPVVLILILTFSI